MPPGAPTVWRAGPALPALLMKMTLCLYTACKQAYAQDALRFTIYSIAQQCSAWTRACFLHHCQ